MFTAWSLRQDWIAAAYVCLFNITRVPLAPIYGSLVERLVSTIALFLAAVFLRIVGLDTAATAIEFVALEVVAYLKGYFFLTTNDYA